MNPAAAEMAFHLSSALPLDLELAEPQTRSKAAFSAQCCYCAVGGTDLAEPTESASCAHPGVSVTAGGETPRGSSVK